MGSGESKGKQGSRTDDLQAVTDKNDLPPIEAIGYVSGGQQEQQSWKKQRKAGIAEVKGAVGDGVDLPGDGDGLRLRTEDSHDPRELIAAEVAGSEGFQAAAGLALRGLRGSGTHLALGYSSGAGLVGAGTRTRLRENAYIASSSGMLV